ENFLMTVDWIDVSLDDAIVNLDLTSIMVACYDSDNFPDVDACDRFTRDEDGQVVDFLTGYTNAAAYTTSRMEIGANYRWIWDNVGDFSHRAQVSYANSRKISVTGEEPDETVGGWTFPKWAGTFDTVFTRGPHRLFWRIIWQEKAKLSVTGDFEYERDDGNPITRTRWRHLHNLSYSYELPKLGDWAPERTMLQFNIDNLFDRAPDATERAAGHYGFSELLGRRYTISLRGTF
ncbi:MAG: hypothetical protein ACOCSR_02510, partial [Wenzhouxiangella sp.]